MINQAGIFKNLLEAETLSDQTYYQIIAYLSSIPVKTGKDGKLIDDVQTIITDGMTFINSFYLEFDSKRDAFPAILNMLQLNFDNFLDSNEDNKVQLLTKDSAK